MAKLDYEQNDDHTITSRELIREGEEDKTRTARNLAEETGFLLNRARLVQDDVSSVHTDALDTALEEGTQRNLKASTKELLTELYEAGYAWRDVAYVVGVSVPALRKWRTGTNQPSSTSRRRLAQFVAVNEELSGPGLIRQPASWLEMPISGTPLTGLDLCANGRLDLVLLLAQDHITHEQALDEYLPDWRERYRTEWEVFTARDGKPAIRVRADFP